MAGALWAQNVVRASEGREGPEFKIGKPMTIDKLSDTHNFTGLLSSSAYKRRHEDVLTQIAKTDAEVRAELELRDSIETAKSTQEREAREEAKRAKLRTDEGCSKSDDTKKSGKVKSKRKETKAVVSGLSFNLEDEA